MAEKMDPLVGRVVAFFGELTGRMRYFSHHQDQHVIRKILQILDANDLARLSRRKGARPTWIATEIFVREIGSIARHAQPRPVRVLPWSNCKYRASTVKKSGALFDTSLEELFGRHRSRCCEWISIDV